MSVLRVIERDLTIAYKVAYTRIYGSDHTCALFLSQVAYWCGNSEDGWAWLTHDRLETQTGMGRKSQDRAASFWISVGVLQKTLRGLPAKINYNVDFDRLEALLLATKVVRNGQAALSELDKHSIEDSLKIPSCEVEAQQQPESEAASSTGTSPSQTLAQTPDQPLSSRATPLPPSGAAPSPRRKAPAEIEFDIPLNLRYPRFLEAWAEWLEFRRKDLKKPVTEMAGKKQLSGLATVGPDAAVAAINVSISSGYTGLFPKPLSGRAIPASPIAPRKVNLL